MKVKRYNQTLPRRILRASKTVRACSTSAKCFSAHIQTPQYVGVCNLRSEAVRRELLPAVPVDEVWGLGSLGRQTREAWNLNDRGPGLARTGRRKGTNDGDGRPHGVRISTGFSCMPLEVVKPTRKGIAVTRNFGSPVTTWLECAKLWPVTQHAQQRRCAVTRWQPTSYMPTPFNGDPFYSNGASAWTNDTGGWSLSRCTWANGSSATASIMRSAA